MKNHSLIQSLLTAGAVCLLSGLWAGLAQAQSLPVGQIVERVVCRADAQQSYALYLPSNYTETRKWPILLAFDPGGRGLRPVELFKEAAEQYGYIVAGSNNSRNGLGGELNRILTTFWQDAHGRLALDENRVYLTGFSGGARVALSLARSLPEQIAGVIACGAGGPPEVSLRKQVPYAILGIAGHEDFNLLELKQLTHALTEAGATNRLITVAGGHAWPPATVATQAVGWLELQAMKTGRRAKDATWVETSRTQQLAAARAAETEARWLAALAGYEALARDFQGLADVAAYVSKAKELQANKEVRESLKRDKTADELQQLRTQRFFELYNRLQENDERALVVGMLKSDIQGLRKKSLANEDNPERTAARRVLSLVFVSLNEMAAQLRAQQRYQDMAVNMALAVEARPDTPGVYFNLARAQALSGSKKQALASLQQAVAHGLNDAPQISNNPDLESLRTEPAYKQLLERMSGK